MLDLDKVRMLLSQAREEMPLHVEMAALSAALARARFNAYVKEGFTEAQAIELCKGAMK